MTDKNVVSGILCLNKILWKLNLFDTTGCLNTKGTHVTTNNSTNNNVVFFFVSDLKKVYYNNN